MGNFTITIAGKSSALSNVDRMTEKFVNQLLEANHSLSTADFTYWDKCDKVSYLHKELDNQELIKDNKFFTVSDKLEYPD